MLNTILWSVFAVVLLLKFMLVLMLMLILILMLMLTLMYVSDGLPSVWER